MTQKEKIELLKTTIIFLYEKEGRSKSYISRLLEVDRKTLIYMINEWELTQGNVKYLSPSNQKFANKNRNLIKSRLDNNVCHRDISKELGVGIDYLKNIIYKDAVLSKANKDYVNRLAKNAEINKNKNMEKSSFEYNIKEIDGEVWKEILGYEGYYISSHGRVKSYVKRYDKYKLLTLHQNSESLRVYVTISNKNLQISRLVGFAFVDGHTEEKNTIDHINGNPSDNRASNLEWVSQSENNKRAYQNGRVVNKAYSRNGKFKKIIVDNKYEFKTIRAFAQFCNISETQAHRYISGECRCDYKIEFIY